MKLDTRIWNDNTDRRYTGQRLSEDLGLYDYRARWYDPLLGRFLILEVILPPTPRIDPPRRHSNHGKLE